MLTTEKRPKKLTSENTYLWKYKQVAGSDCKLPRKAKVISEDTKINSAEKIIRINSTNSKYPKNSTVSNIQSRAKTYV